MMVMMRNMMAIVMMNNRDVEKHDDYSDDE
jgi:hypothetical protein